jgi:hypothetical protein
MQSEAQTEAPVERVRATAPIPAPPITQQSAEEAYELAGQALTRSGRREHVVDGDAYAAPDLPFADVGNPPRVGSAGVDVQVGVCTEDVVVDERLADSACPSVTSRSIVDPALMRFSIAVSWLFVALKCTATEMFKTLGSVQGKPGQRYTGAGRSWISPFAVPVAKARSATLITPKHTNTNKATSRTLPFADAAEYQRLC